MAIQAGRVGVDPSQVTLSGKIKGGGVSPEVLTKEEAARIYQTILGMTEYLKKTDANTLYQKISDMVDYQLKLVSGQNIKRINGEDLLGSGNISVLTTQLADGIYQKISDMADYVLRSELPDMTDLLTKTEAPGYNDILTRTAGLPLINNKLNIDGSSICYKTGAYDFNNFISGVAYGTSTCVSMPTSDTDYFIISSGDVNTRLQIALTITTVPTIYARKMTTVSNVSTWTEWFALPNIADLNRKQDILIAGNGINIVSNTISADTNVLQEKMTAGNGIVINRNTIINRFSNLSNVDLNTIRYNCQVYVGDSCTNKPTSNGGILICTMGSNDGVYGTQLFIPYATTGQGVYYRRFNGSAIPTAWRKLSDCYEAGDTLINGTSTNGFINCPGQVVSTSSIRFTIPLSKPIKANSISFSQLVTYVRAQNGSSGALIIGGIDIATNSDYSFTSNINASGISINLTTPTLTVTPNTSCSVLIGNMNGVFS